MSRHAAVVLAAGRGARYHAARGAAPTKLVAAIDGVPLIRRVAAAACASSADPVIVVTGYEAEAVEAALVALPVRFVHNAAFASGMAGSLRTGIAQVSGDAHGAVVLLGDMPLVTAGLIDRLVAEADAAADWDAVVPVVEGRRGNPVVLSRRLFPAVATLAGDAGARHLLHRPGVIVRTVSVEDPATALDVDEPGDLASMASDGVRRAGSSIAAPTLTGIHRPVRDA